MIINLKEEKELKLSTQDVYDIIDFAMQAAEDEGFINPFIFDRAKYEFAAIILYPELKDKYSHEIAMNVNSAWDTMLNAEVFDNMLKEYPKDIEHLTAIGEEWKQEYIKFSNSARGLLANFQRYNADFMKQSSAKINEIMKDSNVSEILNIADKWGMNNTDKDNKHEDDSLF